MSSDVVLRPRLRPQPLKAKAIGRKAKDFKHTAIEEIKICNTSDS